MGEAGFAHGCDGVGRFFSFEFGVASGSGRGVWQVAARAVLFFQRSGGLRPGEGGRIFSWCGRAGQVVRWRGMVCLEVGAGSFSGDDAGGVEFDVGGAECGDDAAAAALGGAEVDEEDLVFGWFDDLGEFVFECDFFCGGEVAFEDGVLEVVAVIFAGFEDATEAFFVADVVADDPGVSHGAGRDVIV